MPSVKTPTTELDNTAEGAEPASGARPDSSPRAAVSRRYGWLSRLRSYFIFDPLIWLVTVILGIVSIPVSLLGEKGRILHGFARLWSQLIMKIICSPTTVTGLDALDTSRPLVYAVNHASALDIPVLYVYLPFQFRIAFKKELLAYPIVGWHLRRSGQICINQQNPAASIGSIRAALKSLKSGLPLVIFPEGRAHARWPGQTISAGSVFSGDQGAGGYRAGGAGGNLRTPAHEYLSHQVPAAGDARGAAHCHRGIHAEEHGGAFGQSASRGARFARKRIYIKTRFQFLDLSCQLVCDGLHPEFFYFFSNGVFQVVNPFAGHG